MSIAEMLSVIAENMPKVYSAGKKEEQRKFWEDLQVKGTRTNWQYAFYNTYWNDSIYNPIYAMKIGNSNTNMFYNTPITNTKVPLDISGSKLNYTFRDGSIETIPELVVNEKTEINNGFSGASKLKNINITGVLANDVPMGACPLAKESLKSIITALQDCSGTENENAYTLTVKSSAFEKLVEEGATAVYNGTSCTWEKVVESKKWKLVKS